MIKKLSINSVTLKSKMQAIKDPPMIREKQKSNEAYRNKGAIKANQRPN